MDAKRYARHVALREMGAAGQERLEKSSVLIIGLGGLGCPAAQYLGSSGCGLGCPAAQYLGSSGCGKLVLNDFDRVDLSNLPRQVLFGEGDIDALKVDAAAKALRRLNSDLAVECLPDRLGDIALAEAAGGVDIVLDCTDNFSTRLGINRACVATGKPLVSGAALRFEGQISVFRNGTGDPCYRCIYREDDEPLGDCAGNGVLAPVPGVIGTLMALEAVKLAALGDSSLAGVLKLWDAINGDWQSIRLMRDPDCPVCGDG